jgi:hypothetical protein
VVVARRHRTIAGITNAYSEPTDPFSDSFGRFFGGDSEHFVSLELGWTESQQRLFLDNTHLSFWHVDDSVEAGATQGWGVAFQHIRYLNKQWMPFLRAGRGMMRKTPLSSFIEPAATSISSPRPARGAVGAIFALCYLSISACASFTPTPIEEVPFLERAVTKERADLRVTVAVPSPEEGAQLFGVDLAGEGIQPVWVKVENHSDTLHLLLPIAMDEDYFSPMEAARMNHGFLSGGSNMAMDLLFERHNVPWHVYPGQTISGFVYTNLDPGVKFVDVDLRREGGIERFEFVVAVPGLEVDYQRVNYDDLYRPEEMVDVDEQGLRKALEELPCCALGGDRKTPGDPLNLVLIGTRTAVGTLLISRNWDVTEIISGSSVWRMIKSSLFGGRYRTSPVSPLYVFGRKQDIALQKVRSSVDERNHLRLWLTPLRYQGLNVWVGQISRDIGIRFSSKTFVTHKIDPEVDEARYYLIQDLIYSRAVAAGGYVAGVGYSGRDAPRVNYTDDPYYTDGLRMVIIASEQFVPWEQIRQLRWEQAREQEVSRAPGPAEQHAPGNDAGSKPLD